MHKLVHHNFGLAVDVTNLILLLKFEAVFPHQVIRVGKSVRNGC